MGDGAAVGNMTPGSGETSTYNSRQQPSQVSRGTWHQSFLRHGPTHSSVHAVPPTKPTVTSIFFPLNYIQPIHSREKESQRGKNGSFLRRSTQATSSSSPDASKNRIVIASLWIPWFLLKSKKTRDLSGFSSTRVVAYSCTDMSAWGGYSKNHFFHFHPRYVSTYIHAWEEEERESELRILDNLTLEKYQQSSSSVPIRASEPTHKIVLLCWWPYCCNMLSCWKLVVLNSRYVIPKNIGNK